MLLLGDYLDRGLLPMPTPEYSHVRELNFRRTCHDGTLTRAQIEVNIAEILAAETGAKEEAVA